MIGKHFISAYMVGAALLASLIGLTPGSVVFDISEDRTTLYIHAFDCSDPDAERRKIAEGFERRILEALR